MTNQSKISKLAKQIVKPNRLLKTPKIINPTRDWILGMVVAIFVLIITTFWSFNTYFHYKDLTITEQSDNLEPTLIYRENLVDDALTIFINREEKFNSLIDKNKFIDLGESEKLEIEELITETESDIESDTEEGAESNNFESDSVNLPTEVDGIILND